MKSSVCSILKYILFQTFYITSTGRSTEKREILEYIFYFCLFNISE